MDAITDKPQVDFEVIPVFHSIPVEQSTDSYRQIRCSKLILRYSIPLIHNGTKKLAEQGENVLGCDPSAFQPTSSEYLIGGMFYWMDPG